MNEFLMPKVIHYFPPHIANIEEFKRIAKVYDAHLKQIWIELDKMEDNRHFDSMEASECTYWEKNMQIKLTGEETLEDRRRNIKGHWGASRPYTNRKFKEVLDAMVGEKYYKLEINTKEKYLKISLMLEAISKDGYIYDLMRAMAPADMVVKVVIIFNRHRSFKPYTYAQMTKYTHYQLRTATDFETDFNTQVHLATYRHTQLSSYMQAALMTQKL
ncbi:DUF2313 domain-containing protein [Clostridium sp. AM45-5]|nr:putative phage tail protein [Clostridium sp. AM45-5]RHS65877.1 DUF2313 domain-containing protein [Clostridium sp. AM45-5]